MGRRVGRRGTAPLGLVVACWPRRCGLCPRVRGLCIIPASNSRRRRRRNYHHHHHPLLPPPPPPPQPPPSLPQSNTPATTTTTTTIGTLNLPSRLRRPCENQASDSVVAAAGQPRPRPCSVPGSWLSSRRFAPTSTTTQPLAR
ncbi:hypothetical protein E2C01_010955 [Portunus trituberculatus]|uniref:Uncharacterized protein n=1 Tax=Portunus trituberculatus TaxID=210409 RepID=A0A5B7D9Z1_PORTR|nr:hypothetical protein [Portunus trituberculatus]